MTSRRKSPAARRRGAALVAALTLLVIVLLTASALLQQLRAQQQAARSGWNKLQAQWLAESALLRATTRLQADRTYAGETWEVKTGDPSADEADDLGSARIDVRKVPDSEAVMVEVTADFPRDSRQRGRAVLSRQIALPASTN